MAKTAVSQNSQRTPTHDEIAAQAYQIYLREGCVSGRDLEHWLRAEEELRANGLPSGHGNGNGHSPTENGASQSNGNRANRSFVEAPSSAVMTATAAPGPTPVATRSNTPSRKPVSAKR